jgi:hypothetical protein
MTTTAKFLKAMAVFGLLIATAGSAAADDASCMARCQQLESQCLQDSKGDRSKCNAVATQCFQGCRKPK